MEKVLEAIEVAKETGKIRKGVNEVTKAIERGNAELVAIASDVNPKELVMHIPVLCEEKKVQCVQDVASREELGAAAGLAVPTVAVAITKAGKAKAIMTEIDEASEEAAPEAEAPAEAAPAEEEKKEEN